ncbi:hypothetical protein [Herbaspirillum sp. NPDC087042]|uniref:hypothetical protein n=1 Tax=Herbaspirillum sp. NPDC087042 TaxID=3364004 RepID=UPI00380B56C8
MKRLLIRWFVGWTDSWNQEMHREIEHRVIEAHKRHFPEISPNREETIKQMREFYYSRMIATANLLIAAGAILLALVALIVSAIGVIKAW